MEFCTLDKPMRSSRKNTILLTTGLLCLGALAGPMGCMTAYKRSIGANTQKTYQRVFLTDENIAWQAALDSLKSVRLDVSNREAGFLQSRWIDNTRAKNFADSDGSTAPYMKAQYRVKVSIAPGVYGGRKAVRVSVQREQVAIRDALDDYRHLESDSIEENTLLYRIGRVIALKTRLAQLEQARIQEEIRQATASDPTFAPPPVSDWPGGDDGLPPAPDEEGYPADDFIPDAPAEEF
jgi:hypothetical protein